MPLAIVTSSLKLWVITASTAIPKFEDRSRDSGYALLQLQTVLFIESQHTKFEVSSFHHCKDNENFAKFKSRSL